MWKGMGFGVGVGVDGVGSGVGVEVEMKRWDCGARIQDVISKPEVRRQLVQASRKAW
jgi:hypothetical protein